MGQKCGLFINISHVNVIFCPGGNGTGKVLSLQRNFFNQWRRLVKMMMIMDGDDDDKANNIDHNNNNNNHQQQQQQQRYNDGGNV